MANDILKKFKSSNLSDLNANPGDMKSFLKGNADVVLNIFLIVVTLFLTFKFWSEFGQEKSSIETQISQNEKKMGLIEQYEKTESSFAQFIKNFPNFVSGESLSKKMPEMLSKYDIQLNSISQIREESSNAYDSVSINLAINAANFKELGNFIKEVESQPDLYVITSLQIRSFEDQSNNNINDNGPRVEATLTVQSLKLKS